MIRRVLTRKSILRETICKLYELFFILFLGLHINVKECNVGHCTIHKAEFGLDLVEL
jgi:hypothetical protein